MTDVPMDNLTANDDRKERRRSIAARASVILTGNDFPDKEELSPQEYRRRTVKISKKVSEVVIYFVFLITFTFAVQYSRDPTYSFYYNEYMKDKILFEEFPTSQVPLTFYDVATADDFWDYMKGVFVDGYNDGDGLIYGTNLVLGDARLRQLRVKRNSCFHQPPFKQDMYCYAPYAKEFEETGSYGDFNITFKHSTKKELGTKPVQAWIQSYNGGGYVVYLENDYDADLQTLLDLESNGWIDEQTRLVEITFATYNMNINMYFWGTLLFEFLPSGGVLPTAVFRVMSHGIQPTDDGRFIVFMNIFVVLFVIFYIGQELFEITKDKVKYFNDGWNVLDIFNLLLFVIVFILIFVLTFTRSNIDYDTKDKNAYYDLSTFSYSTTTIYNILAFNAFLLWFKVFKYTKFFRATILITDAIRKCVIDLLWFTVMVSLVILGMAQAGMLAFGTDVEDYRSFGACIFTLVRFLLGDFDFTQIYESNRLVGTIYFFGFTILFVFILLNISLAIVNDSYIFVQEEHREKEFKGNPEFVWAVQELLARFDGYIPAVVASTIEGKLADIDKVKSKVQNADVDGIAGLSREEVERMLQDAPEEFAAYLGVADTNDVFAQFDADDDGIIDEQEQAEMMRRLEQEKQTYELITEQVKQVKGEDTLRYLSEIEDDGDDGAVGRGSVGVIARSLASETQRVDALGDMVTSLHKKLDILTELVLKQNQRSIRRSRAASSAYGSSSGGTIGRKTPAMAALALAAQKAKDKNAQ